MTEPIEIIHLKMDLIELIINCHDESTLLKAKSILKEGIEEE